MTRLDNAHAVIIGVGADLRESVKDATAIYNILVDESLCGYKEENVQLITEEKATKENILRTLKRLTEETDEESSILLFYSGHGGYHEGAQIYYLQPNDFSATNYIDAQDLRNIINDLKSKRLVLLLDCCHAAGMFKEGIGTNQTQLRDNPKSDQNDELTNAEGLAQKIDGDQGISIVSSCRENQLSWIMDGDTNSLFTKCLLQVLKAEHKSYFEDRYIRISEVVQYIFKKVPEIQPSQNPYVNLQIYDDFVLSNIPQALQSSINHTLSDNRIETKTDKARKELVTTFRESPKSTNLLLFVHGFTGETSDTFGKMPDYLISDQNMDGWDIKPLGYSPNMSPETGNSVLATDVDINRISDYIATSMKYKFAKYQRVAIIAHSLGGLAVQKSLLSMADNDRERISHVILFGTPSLGLEENVLVKLWNGRFKELSADNDFIKTIRSDWKTTFNDKYSFFFKVAAGLQDQYVSIKSCHSPFKKDYREFVSGDHFSMVKPETPDNDSYQLVIKSLTGNEFFNAYTNNEEINLLLGDYETVVTELLPISDDLDLPGLKRLIFALEGLDRRSEIYDLLDKHDLARNNSDLMGIIGGRYKRDYLTSFRRQDGETAYTYYIKGLKMSQEKASESQIYYHAINLAFLSLILNSDESEMVRFAEMALNATDNCRDNVWKIATVAEANLYLNNMIVAQEKYTEAAKVSDIRQKLSMYTNAFAAYTTLMDTTSESDSFIRFLHRTLLH